MYHEHKGVVYTLGYNVDEANGRNTSSALIEDSPHMLTMDAIMKIAAAGTTDKRAIFDKTWILNQKSHGSCVGFSCAGTLAKTRFRRNQERQRLSGAYVYSKINGGTDRGAALEDGKNALEKYGACLESTVGWDAIYPKRQPANADSEGQRFKAFESYAVGSLQGMWTALALEFDVVVAVQVGRSFSNLDSEGIAGHDSGMGNHCAHADGVILVNDKLTALGVNSWDYTWGDDGRMKLQDAHFTQTMKYAMFFAVRSSTDDPNAPVPPDVA